MDYVRVASETELTDALRLDGAALLCGGTDLLVKMRAGIVRPKVLVDVTRVDSLRQISARDGSLSIGAAVVVADILASTVVRERYPLLATVLGSLGSVQIRNRASLGGNLGN